jgi:hypothetical protein
VNCNLHGIWMLDQQRWCAGTPDGSIVVFSEEELPAAFREQSVMRSWGLRCEVRALGLAYPIGRRVPVISQDTEV